MSRPMSARPMSARPRTAVIPVFDENAVMEEYLSDEKLQEASGCADLTRVSSIQLIVDTTDNSISDIGLKLPNLIQIKLNNSVLSTIRDLGTALKKLQVLWLSRCSLAELDGISSMPQLRELYLSFNDVSDLSPLTDLEQLETLDLEGNRVNDINQVMFLASCEKLVNLTLDGNGVSELPDYRAQVRAALPQLQYLDDLDISVSDEDAGIPDKDDEEIAALAASVQIGSNGSKIGSSNSSANGSRPSSGQGDRLSEKQLLNEAIKYARLGFESDSSAGDGQQTILLPPSPRPATASSRPLTAKTARAPATARPGSASVRPGTSSTFRPGTARPGTAALRPGSARAGGPSSSQDAGVMNLGSRRAEEDSSSELTFGSDVICGNPVKSLRSRKIENQQPSPHFETTPTSTSEFLLEELRAWKINAASKGEYVETYGCEDGLSNMGGEIGAGNASQYISSISALRNRNALDMPISVPQAGSSSSSADILVISHSDDDDEDNDSDDLGLSDNDDDDSELSRDFIREFQKKSPQHIKVAIQQELSASSAKQKASSSAPVYQPILSAGRSSASSFSSSSSASSSSSPSPSLSSFISASSQPSSPSTKNRFSPQDFDNSPPLSPSRPPASFSRPPQARPRLGSASFSSSSSVDSIPSSPSSASQELPGDVPITVGRLRPGSSSAVRRIRDAVAAAALEGSEP